MVKKSKPVCITTCDKRKIVEKVKMLSKDVHMEIFYYLHKINSNYTLNGNGVFFNLNNLDDKTLCELKKMVIFYNKNERILKENYLDRYTKNDMSDNIEIDNTLKDCKTIKDKDKNSEDISDESSDGSDGSSDESSDEDIVKKK
jgi:hypothetical protein